MRILWYGYPLQGPIGPNIMMTGCLSLSTSPHVDREIPELREMIFRSGAGLISYNILLISPVLL